jgi:hypothetical protein
MCLWNGFLAAAPGHPYLAKAIETVVNQVRNRFTSVDVDAQFCPNKKIPSYKLQFCMMLPLSLLPVRAFWGRRLIECSGETSKNNLIPVTSRCRPVE